MKKLIIATNNKGKLKEIKEIFADMPYEILNLEDMGINIHVEEDADDFAGNSYKKAYEVCRVVNEMVLADDSGLEVDALDGLPGVYSARFAGENATDRENYEKLLTMMEGVPEEKRTAAFKCVVTLMTPDGNYVQAEGRCPGRISFEPSGSDGFGYDPVFIVDGYNRTMAELTMEEKNKKSHRGIALRNLKKMLK